MDTFNNHPEVDIVLQDIELFQANHINLRLVIVSEQEEFDKNPLEIAKIHLDHVVFRMYFQAETPVFL